MKHLPYQHHLKVMTPLIQARIDAAVMERELEEKGLRKAIIYNLTQGATATAPLIPMLIFGFAPNKGFINFHNN